MRFAPEPRCPECGESLDRDSFDLEVFAQHDLNKQRHRTRDATVVGVMLLLVALFSIGGIPASRAIVLVWLLPVTVFAGFAVATRVRSWRGKPDTRLYFSTDGVFAAEQRGLNRIVTWKKVGSVGLKKRRRGGRWQITLLGYWYKVYRKSSSFKFDIVAEADDARRVAERLREFRNAALNTS